MEVHASITLDKDFCFYSYSINQTRQVCFAMHQSYLLGYRVLLVYILSILILKSIMTDLNIMYVAIIMNFKLIPFRAGQPASPVERFTLWLSVKQGLLSCSHVFPVWKLSNWLRAERARAKPPLKLTHLGV